MNYYNENDPFAAAWLRELVKEGHISNGEVDERSIEDVKANELTSYNQCHFFAGIGGWSYALRLAGWPDDKPCWTGSCPCQPYSTSGKRTGMSDERHLWPSFFHLIQQRKPAVVFGEQVESAINQCWLDLVQTDLEHLGYAVGAVVLPAASVGSPQLRSRLYFVADASNFRREQRGSSARLEIQGKRAKRKRQHPQPQHEGVVSGGSERLRRSYENFWTECEWLYCRDGVYRATKPGIRVLVDGVSAGVGKIRGFGNAVVPQVAQAFIESYLDPAQKSHLTGR